MQLAKEIAKTRLRKSLRFPGCLNNGILVDHEKEKGL
jgi:hypothetical protein